MKKHDEGYVLAMVMVVIAVLAIVASAMLSIGLRNVQTQQVAVERMQAKYEAEGIIEKVVAELAIQETNGNVRANVESEFKTAINSRLEDYNKHNGTGDNDRIQIKHINWPTEENEQVCNFTIETEKRYTIVSKDKTINEKIMLKADIELKYKVEQPEKVIDKLVASVDTMKYISYETTTVTE